MQETTAQLLTAAEVTSSLVASAERAGHLGRRAVPPSGGGPRPGARTGNRAPPLLNDFISLQKDTALLSVIFVFEAMFSAQDYNAFNFNYTSFVVAALLFICLTIPLTRFTDWLGTRMMHA